MGDGPRGGMERSSGTKARLILSTVENKGLFATFLARGRALISGYSKNLR